MNNLTASLVGLAMIATPVLAQQTDNSMSADRSTTRVHTRTTTAHVQATVPTTTHRERHHRVVRHHHIVRHHPVMRHHRHHHHVVKQTTVTTTTTHS